jgi:digeranylgeranylglycerophospholipid reductase
MAKLAPRKSRYDVVVVGAGPAGSMAARAAAQEGASTLLIDKKRDIGVPLRCGGIVARFHTYEDRLGYRAPSRVIFNDHVTGIMMYAPSGKATPVLPIEASIIDRRLFDKFLASEAARAGAETLIDARVTRLLRSGGAASGVEVRVGGRTFEIGARVVVGADGHASSIGRWCGLGVPARAVPMLGYEYVNVQEPELSTVRVFASQKLLPGAHATWIPLESDSVYFEILYYPELLNQRVSITDVHTQMCQHPALRDRLARAEAVCLIAGGGPLAAPLPKTVAPGVILAGDAAGQSLAAQVAGIGSAVTCGHFAGQVAAQAVKREDASEKVLGEYEDLWRKTIGKTILANVEGNDLFMQIASSDDLIERAVEELGEHFIGLIILPRNHVEHVREWLRGVEGKA